MAKIKSIDNTKCCEVVGRATETAITCGNMK